MLLALLLAGGLALALLLRRALLAGLLGRGFTRHRLLRFTTVALRHLWFDLPCQSGGYMPIRGQNYA